MVFALEHWAREFIYTDYDVMGSKEKPLTIVILNDVSVEVRDLSQQILPVILLRRDISCWLSS